MSRIAVSFKVVALAMLWTTIVEISGERLLGLSFVDGAHAAAPAANQTVNRAPRRGNVDVDVDVDRRGPVRRDVDVDVDVDRGGPVRRDVDVDVDVDRRGPGR